MAPPAKCDHCGWQGITPQDHIDGSARTELVTWLPVNFPCPNCGRDARVLIGSDALLGDLLHLIRESEAPLRALMRYDATARDVASVTFRGAGSRWDEDQARASMFLAEHPETARMVEALRGDAGRDWLMILLAILAIVIPYLQNEHLASKTAATTSGLSDADVARIAAAVEQQLRTTSPADLPRLTRRPPPPPPRKRHEQARKKPR